MIDDADSMFLADFEARLVLDGLDSNGLLGVAVSGGADSMALLVALLHRVGAERLRVITVNHCLRAAAETDGDAAFVADFCAHIGVPCAVVVVGSGVVRQTACIRRRGEEEAARFLRYQAFERFVAQQGLFALCLAHNRDDQLETLVMRFLQGSAACAGMAYRRGNIIRPLLQIARNDIERYLCLRGIGWRTDSTNADTRFLRNAIRHHLLPVLDERFPGWRQAVLTGAEKARDDDAALAADSARFVWQRGGESSDDDGELSMPAASFYAQSVAVRRRLFYRALTELDCGGRFPYTHVRQVLHWASDDGAHLSADGVECGIKNERLFIKKARNGATEIGFFGILAQIGDSMSVMGRRLCVRQDDVLLMDDIPVCRVKLPVCVRSFQGGDRIADACGRLRSLSSIFSGWHIPLACRSAVPVVQELSVEGQPLVAVLAGQKNWIVRSAQL